MPYVINSYLLKQDKTTEYLILFIALFLIILIWAGILYKSTYFGEGQTKALLTCAPGDCPTNRFSGEKRCNKNKSLPLQYDPIYEVCNPSNACTAIETPYAVQSNGSTSLSGTCDVDGCQCITQLYTPSFIESIFNLQYGAVSSNTGVQNMVLTQTPNPYVGEGNNVPINYTDPSSQFWQIGWGNLAFLTPNICSDLLSSSSDPTPDNSTALECINRNPCLAGRLSYIPQDSSAFVDFSSQNLQTTGLGCVPNSVMNPPYPSKYPNSCENDLTNPDNTNYFAPVFNQNLGKVFCFDTSIPIVP
jgi:hypothetical protein